MALYGDERGDSARLSQAKLAEYTETTHWASVSWTFRRRKRMNTARRGCATCRQLASHYRHQHQRLLTSGLACVYPAASSHELRCALAQLPKLSAKPVRDDLEPRQLLKAAENLSSVSPKPPRRGEGGCVCVGGCFTSACVFAVDQAR